MTGSTSLLLSAALGLLAAATVLVGLGRRRQVSDFDDRLGQFGARPLSLEEEELQVPFARRMLVPIVQRLAVLIASRAPQRSFDQTRQKLTEAGNPGHISVAELLGLRILLALGLGGALFLFGVAGNALGSGLLLGMALGWLGYLMPGIWLSRMAKIRKTEITRSLPDAIDLLTISVESGLGFDPALMRVAEKWDNALTREFGRALTEMWLGKSKREALREMSERVNVDDLRLFVSSIIQADQLGVAMSQVLRIQSEAMRLRRRQRAEERAHKAPIKMLFPMAFLIFPALYVIILGPAIPIVLRSFGD